jgi:hypothetical protein
LPLINVLLRSVFATTAPSTRLRLSLGYDVDDSFWSHASLRNETLALIEAQGRDRDLSVVATPMVGTHGKPCWVWNRLLQSSCEEGCEYFLQIGDDVELMTPGWADMFVQALSQNPFLANFGVAGPMDAKYVAPNARRSGAPPMLTQSFTHCTHLAVFGGLYPDAFANWWSDDWISQVYGRRNTFALADLKVSNVISSGGQRYGPQYAARAMLRPLINTGRTSISNWLRTWHPTLADFTSTQLTGRDAPWIEADQPWMHPQNATVRSAADAPTPARPPVESASRVSRTSATARV